MKQDKIFLEKNRNVRAINKTNNVNVSLEQKTRLLPFDDLSDALNLAQLYNDERDTCTKYRLIFTINALCSNVLYNMRSEVVYKENTDNCSLAKELLLERQLVSPNSMNIAPYITSLQAIRDTEYSHPKLGNLTYNCGIDIFNNHILRAKGFHPIWGPSGSTYNTVSAFSYNSELQVIQEELDLGDSQAQSDTHVYRIDNLMTMEEAFVNRAKEVDGWFGFENPSLLKLPNGKEVGGEQIIINRLLNNRKECEFIDFYPDRSLFSFIPKVNKERKRVEYNWDYCITYPYASDSAKFNTVMGAGNHSGITTNVRASKGGNGEDIYVFTSIINNNLKYGDTIRLYSFDPDDEWYEDVMVQGVGDENGLDKEHCFKIYKNSFRDQVKIDEIQRGLGKCGIKKLAGVNECKYYFRKFKKYKLDDKLPNSSINKLAFGENIYGDRTAQIVFTDDIDVMGLRDNLGRPLTELYLTVVKANRGYQEWYYDNNYTADTIECSHAFGKVTSGVDLGPTLKDYNVRQLHNVTYNFITSAYQGGFEEIFGRNATSAKTLENDIKMSDMNVFYGDIVEFDPTTNSETVLERVYHRVNTAQRECTNSAYYDIWYDKLISDDYEANVTFGDVQNLGASKKATHVSGQLGVEYEKIVFPQSGSTQTMWVYATERQMNLPDDNPPTTGSTGDTPFQPYDPIVDDGGGNIHNPIDDINDDSTNPIIGPSDSVSPLSVNTGDRVLGANNQEIENFGTAYTWYLISKPDWVTVEKQVSITIPSSGGSLGNIETIVGWQWLEVPIGTPPDINTANCGGTQTRLIVGTNNEETARTGEVRIYINGHTYTITVSQFGTLSLRGTEGFKVVPEHINVTKNGDLFPGNIQLEGYYYAPHTRVPIKALADDVTKSVGYVLSYPEGGLAAHREIIDDDTVCRIGITGASQHDYVINDLFGIITTDNTIMWYNLYSKKVDKDAGIILVLEPVDSANEIEPGEEAMIDQVVLCNDAAPRYSSYNKKEQSFVWREILPYSRTSENSEIGDATFTNGAIYRHQNVTFEMRRQDPFGQNGLLSPKKEASVGSPEATTDANPLKAYKKKGMMVNLSGLIYMVTEVGNSCI